MIFTGKGEGKIAGENKRGGRFAENHEVFLQVNHKKLDVYRLTLDFVVECYRLTDSFPDREKFGMVAQVRRAALSAHLNIAEGASRVSKVERCRFFEVSRGSLVEVDAAFEVASKVGYLNGLDIKPVGDLITRIFQMVTKLIHSTKTN